MAASRPALTPVHPQPDLDVTVIIPCRDRVDMLRDAIEGILAQDFPADRMELVIVDGESTEPVQALVEELDATAPFDIRYFRHTPDEGPVTKRVFGVTQARGALIAFTDSDCRPTPGWLSAGTAPFADAAVGLVSGPVTYKPEQEAHFFSKLSAETLVEHPTYPTANAFYRRAVFLEMGGFDDSLGVRDFLNRATECADTDFAWQVRKAGWANVFAEGALVYHEIEDLTPFKWLMEPTRLILLPLLVRMHPEIGEKLLRWNLVFYHGTLAIYVGVLFVLLALIFKPAALWLIPVGFAALAVKRAKSLNPARLWQGLREAGYHQARMAVLAVTLVVGSVRYRRLVL